MTAPTQADPDCYVWEVPGEPVVVHIRHEVIEPLAREVAFGFRSVPKRGAEVGGLLLGTITEGSPTIVRIDSYEVVPCHYRLGPSYDLTEEDGDAFKATRARAVPAASPTSYAVGYFRSHTREGMNLDSSDLELLNACFDGPSYVALLVKPRDAQPSRAGFFCRHGDVFPEATPLEFTFGVADLLNEEAPPLLDIERGGALELEMPALQAAEMVTSEEPTPEAEGPGEYKPVPVPFPAVVEPEGREYENEAPPISSLPSIPPVRSGWLWIPLSFLAMIVGVVVGFQVAPSLNPPVTANSGEEYSLALSATANGENLEVRWNRQSPVIRSAQKAILEIEEGGYAKSVDLDSSQLRNGTLVYRYSLDSVRFRLTVFPNARVSVAESLTWKR